MKIAVASGKGGTGKTTVATSLARALSGSGTKVQLIDCDVEEPDAHVYLNPEIIDQRSVKVVLPQVDQSLCSHCRKCQDFCRFNAIVAFPDRTAVFKEMCHACGGCMIVCPDGALKRTERETGMVEKGRAGNISFAQGRIDVGEARATPVISAVMDEAESDAIVILDAPPGTSCPFIETAGGADIVLLVTEPTPFGMYDLTMAVEALRKIDKPFGVVINKYGTGDDAVERYLADEGIDVWMRIDHERKIAEALAAGTPLIDVKPEYAKMMRSLYGRIEETLDAG